MITVATAEAAIGLAIVVIVFRKTTFVDVDEVADFKRLVVMERAQQTDGVSVIASSDFGGPTP